MLCERKKAGNNEENIRLTKTGGKVAEGRRDWLMSTGIVD